MNKSELCERLAGRRGLKKAVAKVAVEDVFAMIAEALASGDEVGIAGIWTFAVRGWATRTGRNPQTGEVLSIPVSKAPSFKAGKALKDAVNNQSIWDRG